MVAFLVAQNVVVMNGVSVGVALGLDAVLPDYVSNQILFAEYLITQLSETCDLMVIDGYEDCPIIP